MKTENLLRRMGRIKGEGPELDDACLSTESLAALRSDRVSTEERERLEGHLAECGRCLDHLLCLGKEQPTLAAGTLRRVLAATEPEQVEQRRVTRMPQWALGAVAAAALVLVFIMPNRSVDPVPAYDLTVTGGVAQFRGEGEPAPAETAPSTAPAATVATFTPESDLSLWLSPAMGARAKDPKVAAYLLQPDGSWAQFEPAPRVAVDGQSGQIEVTVRAGSLLGQRYGRHQVMVAVLPGDSKAPERVSSEADLPGARVVRTEIEYHAP